MTDTRSPIPSATYRLQFNKHFTFRQARDLAPYFRELGVSHVYASPFFVRGPAVCMVMTLEITMN